MNWSDFSFIERSKTRKVVFLSLDKPKTPTQMAKESNLNVGFVSNIIISLLKRGLITCLNPKDKRHRLYTRTKKGELLYKQIKKE